MVNRHLNTGTLYGRSTVACVNAQRIMAEPKLPALCQPRLPVCM